MPSRLAPLLFDMRCRVRRRGVRPILAAVGGRLRTRVRGSTTELIVLLKELDEIAEPSRRAGVRVEELEERHLDALAELNRKRCHTRADARFAEYLELGYGGFAGFVDGQLVGYYWYGDAASDPPFPDLRNLPLEIELGEGDVYGSDFFLLEEHRGGGTAAEFLFGVESAFKARGYRRLWGYVVSDNRPARWLYATRGYESTWRMSIRRTLFGRQVRRMPA
jgi:GNAT superfamily N-acetyltransferase